MKPIEVIKLKREHLARLANQSGSTGEYRAVDKMTNWLPRPRGEGLKILLLALKESGVEIKGSSFDAVALPKGLTIDFTDFRKVKKMLPEMIFIEIKSASQSRVKKDFSGFFFALTESEISAAQALGERHKVALYNKLTGQILISSVPEIVERAKSTNWQVSVQL